VVECGGLENRCTVRYRGFESLSLRQFLWDILADIKYSCPILSNLLDLIAGNGILYPMKARDTKGFKKWEYPKSSKIWIREVINIHKGEAFNGSYQVTIPAKVSGSGRKRRQFKDLATAKRWASDEYRGVSKQGEDYFKTQAAERRQFVEIIPELREKGLTLREVVDFAVPRLRPKGGDKTVAALIEEMITSKETRYGKGELRYYSVKDFRIRAKRFAEYFGDSLVRDLTALEIKEWLQFLDLAPRSTKNFLAVVSEILRHAKQSKLILEIPLDDLTDLERKELYGGSRDTREPSILSVREAQLLMAAAEERRDLGLLPVLTLGLFCGLRTEEIKRLDWKDVHLNEDAPFVSVSAKIAKKRRIRNVDIPDNAAAWLSICHKKNGRIIASSYMAYLYRRLHELLAHAGLGEKGRDGSLKTRWENNSMRHSFGSYHFASHGNSLVTARLLGHKTNDQVLFDHYRALAKKSDGEKFFGIKPAQSSRKVIHAFS
jgi:integrase